MTLTNAPPGSGLFVLLALFLTVATVWLLLRAIETRPKEIDARSFLVLIIVIIPFVMVIYFGLATIIRNEIVAARSNPPILPSELSLRKIVPATVTYIGLSAGYGCAGAKWDTCGEARRIAANIAKLPELLR